MKRIYFTIMLAGCCNFLSVGGQLMASGGCDPRSCVDQVQVQNIFLRPTDSSGLPPPVICEQQSPNSFFALITCWSQQCGPNFGGNPTILNAVRTINDVCLGDAKFKVYQGLQQCRIYYPSQQASPLPPDLANECQMSTRAETDIPRVIEARITKFFSPYATFADRDMDIRQPTPFLEDPNMSLDLSSNSVPRGRPIVGTDITEGWTNDNWQWPAATNSPNFPLVFPHSTLPYAGTNQQDLLACMQVSDLMDCTLARTCGPDLGQVMKSLAMIYLGCSAVVRTSAVCDVNRVRYCMRVEGGNIFDVFDPARYAAYCLNYRAVLACIDKDCPTNAAGNADLRLLEQYKLFLQKFCVDQQYQAAVVRASINCPLFQGVDVFPATSRSMTCAQQLMQRQAAIPQPNLCTIVEANTYCLAQDRRCVYEDLNSQKTALLDMIGCNPAGVLQNDIIPNLANLQNDSPTLRPLSICPTVLFLFLLSILTSNSNAV